MSYLDMVDVIISQRSFFDFIREIKRKNIKYHFLNKSSFKFSSTDYSVQVKNQLLLITVNFLSLTADGLPLSEYLLDPDKKYFISCITAINARLYEILADNFLYAEDFLFNTQKYLNQYNGNNGFLSKKWLLWIVKRNFNYSAIQINFDYLWLAISCLSTEENFYKLASNTILGSQCLARRKVVLRFKKINIKKCLTFFKPKKYFLWFFLQEYINKLTVLKLHFCFEIKLAKKTLCLGQPIFLGVYAWLANPHNKHATTEFDYWQLAAQHKLH